jgi:hypothetical protein
MAAQAAIHASGSNALFGEVGRARSWLKVTSSVALWVLAWMAAVHAGHGCAMTRP